MEDEKWEKYYDNLDPDGKKFWNSIKLVSELQEDFFHFLLERGQLYGVVLHLMEKYNVDSFEVSNEEMLNIKRAMLYFELPEDRKDVLIVRKGYPWGQ